MRSFALGGRKTPRAYSASLRRAQAAVLPILTTRTIQRHLDNLYAAAGGLARRLLERTIGLPATDVLALVTHAGRQLHRTR